MRNKRPPATRPGAVTFTTELTHEAISLGLVTPYVDVNLQIDHLDGRNSLYSQAQARNIDASARDKPNPVNPSVKVSSCH